MATWNGTPNATKNNVTALTASATPEHSLLSSHAPGKRKKLVSWRFSLVWEKFYKDQEEKKKMQRSLFLQTDNHIHTHVCTHSSWRIFRKERNTHTLTHTQVSYLHCLKEATVWRAGWHFHTETLSSDTERQREGEGERGRGGGKEGRKSGREKEGGTDWQGECRRGKRSGEGGDRGRTRVKERERERDSRPLLLVLGSIKAELRGVVWAAAPLLSPPPPPSHWIKPVSDF